MRHVGLGTESQFKGAVFGTVVGGVIGALVGLAIGWFLLSDLDTSVRVILPMVLGAAAGAGGQFVYWGSRTPELENETSPTSGAPPAGSTDEHTPELQSPMSIQYAVIRLNKH